ncbi:MAG: hypothetical protein OET21_15040, partial [Desulfobacterales bacterium]|nr:hypothetical protein [Desulfobacterales bacterium]
QSVLPIHLSTLLEVKRMRRSIYLIFLITVLWLSSGSLYAADLKDGFFDIQWKTNLSQLAGFKKVGENLNVSYYMNPKRVFTIDDIRIPDVVYGSHANQFFAVYVNIDNIEVFAQIRRHLNRNYGVPKITQRMPAEQTTYQWKHEKTKIKLKTYENKNNMKMAFYYTPLSRKVNESQQEAFHENFRRPRFPLDDRRMQRAKDVMEFEGLGPR